MIDDRLTLSDAELEAYRQATLRRHEWWWRLNGVQRQGRAALDRQILEMREVANG